MNCPHCGAFARIRNSETVTATTRQGLIECTNHHCCWRGKFILSLTYTLSPALEPCAGIDLPVAPHIARQLQSD